MAVFGMRCCPTRKELPLLLAVLLYFASEFMITTTLYPYLSFGVCHDLYPNTSADVCLHINQHPEETHKMQNSIALVFMAEKISSNVLPLVVSGFLGPWSDRHGRRLPMMAPYVGVMVSASAALVAIYVHNVPVLVLLFAGLVLKSCISSKIIFRLVASSCVADLVRNCRSYEEIGAESSTVSECQRLVGERAGGDYAALSAGSEDEDERMIRDSQDAALVNRLNLVAMCRLQLAETAGSVLGSTCAWLLQLAGGAFLALLAGLGCSLSGLLVAACWVKDYRNVANPHTGEVADSAGAVARCGKRLREVFSCRKLDVSPVLVWSCSFAALALVASKASSISIFVPYVQRPPLSWPNDLFAAKQAVCCAVQAVFLFLVAPLLGDSAVVVVSIVANTVGFVWMAFCRSTWSMMVAVSLASMVNAALPALRAVLSSQVNKKRVGQVLSKLAMAEAMGKLVGPPLFLIAYLHTKDFSPGLIFLALSGPPAAVLVVWAVMGLLYVPRKNVSKEDRPKAPALAARDATRRPRYTRSMDIPTKVEVCGPPVSQSSHC